MPEPSLKQKTKYGLIWSSIERFGTQGVQFIFGIILARLLSPEAYGIIAMPLVFLAIAQCFIDSGFGNALIRKPELKEEDLSTAFYFNIAVGVVCYLLLFLTSPLIADFFNTPILSKILKVTALATLFNPLCTVQQTILTRKIDFKTQAKISVSSQLLTGVVGIFLAIKGYGVWALVFQQVAGSTLRTILLWVLTKWYPKTGWSKDSLQYLWGFGSKMLASGLLDTAYNNITPIIIGRYFNAADLGNYTRAQNFSQLPSSNLTGVLQRVTFPVLSSIQDDDERLRVNYRKILKLAAFCIFPLMVGLASVSDPFIRLLIGDKWEGCIPLLSIICLGMMWYPIHAINLNLLQVKGRSDLFLKLEIIKKIFGVLILLASIPFGIIYMACAGVAGSLFSLVVNTYYTGKIINVGFWMQMKDLLPILLSCLLMACVIIAINLFVTNLILELALDLIFGVIVYFICSKMLMKEELEEIKRMLPKRKNKA